MNTFQPGDNIDDIGNKLMENLAEQIIALFDTDDPKTAEFYWHLCQDAG